MQPNKADFSEHNPYAAPLYMAEAVTPQPIGGLWRQGKVLVMHKQAPLPDICVKSNLPARRRLKRHLTWCHPLISLTILAGLLVYVVLHLVLRKQAIIHVAMTDQWHARRRNRLLIGWAVLLASIGIVIASLAVIETHENAAGGGLAAGVLLFLFSLLYLAIAPRMVWPKRITANYVWLKGVHPEFLDRLPVLPAEVNSES